MTLVTGIAVTKYEKDSMRQALQNKDPKVLGFIKLLSENHGKSMDDLYKVAATKFDMTVEDAKKFYQVLNTTGYES